MDNIINFYHESILFKILIFMILCIIITKLYKIKKESFTNPLLSILIYDKLSDSFKLNYEISKLSKSIPLKSTILDINCSTGQYVHRLSIRGYIVYGVDMNQQNIEYCNKKYKYSFQYSDLNQSMIYNPQTFDNIICMNLAIYKIKNKDTLFQNIYDWLKPGGYLFIYLVNEFKFTKKYNINGIKEYNPKITQISDVEYSLKEYIKYNNNSYYYETPLYFYPKSKIITMAKDNGFIVDTLIQLTKNEFIYKLKKPN